MAQPLDVKKWITAAIAVFVILSILEYLANLWILMPAFPQMFPTEGVSENPMVQRLWIYLGRAIFSVRISAASPSPRSPRCLPPNDRP